MNHPLHGHFLHALAGGATRMGLAGVSLRMRLTGMPPGDEVIVRRHATDRAGSPARLFWAVAPRVMSRVCVCVCV